MGGAIILGQDPTTNAWFYGGRLGIGLGGGFGFDPEGKRPGAEKKSSCEGEGSGTTYGTFGDYGASVGPYQLPIEQFSGGIDSSTGKTYSEGPTLGGGLTFGNGASIDIGGSFGIEIIGHN